MRQQGTQSRAQFRNLIEVYASSQPTTVDHSTAASVGGTGGWIPSLRWHLRRDSVPHCHSAKSVHTVQELPARVLRTLAGRVGFFLPRLAVYAPTLGYTTLAITEVQKLATFLSSKARVRYRIKLISARENYLLASRYSQIHLYEYRFYNSLHRWGFLSGPVFGGGNRPPRYSQYPV